jgi:putative tricarboxylic transport membrane protein
MRGWFGHLNTRTGDLVVAIALIMVAAIVSRECVRLGAGWGASGPQPGFYPFWCAVTIIVGCVVVLVQTLRGPAGRPLFDASDDAREVLKVGLPMIVAVASLPALGFYAMTALYMGFFAAWYGRYRWYVALAVAVLLPVVLYFALERGFRIALLKSALYGDLIPF